MARAQFIAEQLNDGMLPDRVAIGDEMEPVALDPTKVQSDTGVPKQWQCAYCRLRRVCVEIGPGPVQLAGVRGVTC
jgi:hypothetical protein